MWILLLLLCVHKRFFSVPTEEEDTGEGEMRRDEVRREKEFEYTAILCLCILFVYALFFLPAASGFFLIISHFLRGGGC